MRLHSSQGRKRQFIYRGILFLFRHKLHHEIHQIISADERLEVISQRTKVIFKVALGNQVQVRITALVENYLIGRKRF